MFQSWDFLNTGGLALGDVVGLDDTSSIRPILSPADMTSPPKIDPRTITYTLPFLVFMGFLAVPEALSMVGVNVAAANPQLFKFWLYFAQTVVALGVLACVWKRIEFGPVRGLLLASGCGILGIVVWLLPGNLFHSLAMNDGWWKYLGFAARDDGFNPQAVCESGSAMYWGVVGVRFFRLVVVVPLVEELFWRGFLMRYLNDLDGDYWQMPFGTFHQRSLLGVTLAFVLVHSSVDYLAAAVFGLLMYAVAVRTKSLAACVLMHGVANLILGAYVMSTERWGYW